jgi:hypothetical protein
MSTIHFPEPQGNTSEFNIDWTPATKTLETIKWVIFRKKSMKFIMDCAQDSSYMKNHPPLSHGNP